MPDSFKAFQVVHVLQWLVVVGGSAPIAKQPVLMPASAMLAPASPSTPTPVRQRGSPHVCSPAEGRLNDVIAKGEGGPLMKLFATHDPSHLLAVWETAGENVLVTEQALMALQASATQTDATQPHVMSPVHLTPDLAPEPPVSDLAPSEITPRPVETQECDDAQTASPLHGLAPSTSPADVCWMPAPNHAVSEALAHAAAATANLPAVRVVGPFLAEPHPMPSGCPAVLAPAANPALDATVHEAAVTTTLSAAAVAPQLSRLHNALSGAMPFTPAVAGPLIPDQSFEASQAKLHCPGNAGHIAGLGLNIAGFGLAGGAFAQPPPPDASLAPLVPGVPPHDSAVWQQAPASVAAHNVLPGAAPAFATPPRVQVSSVSPARPSVVMSRTLPMHAFGVCAFAFAAFHAASIRTRVTD